MGASADKHRGLHEVFNNREWEKMRSHAADDMTYKDHPRGLEMKNADEFLDWLKGWTSSFSDARTADVTYMDIGHDTSLARFRARGKNDGPLGSIPATGGNLDQEFWELIKFDGDGKIAEGAIMYDQMTMLVSLGVVPPPE